MTMSRGKPIWEKAAAGNIGSQLSAAPKIGPDIKAEIGAQLRLMYVEVVKQGVPDRFVEILRGFNGPNNDEVSKNEPS
jgi:Anti-sigma factor NepR